MLLLHMKLTKPGHNSLTCTMCSIPRKLNIYILQILVCYASHLYACIAGLLTVMENKYKY